MLPLDPRRSARALGGVVGGLLLLCSGLPAASAAAAGTPATACGQRVLDRPQPAARAVPRLSRTQRQHIAGLNDLSLSGLQDVAGTGPAGDDTLWLDPCGRGFYMDSAAPAAAGPVTSSAGSPAGAASATTSASTATGSGPAGALADTLALQSDPTSTHTVYLDFVGATVTGSAWNDAEYGAGAASSITAAPYSLDSTVSTAFSAAELTQIQRAWLVVSEDYAPYDVNVTTRDPGVDALQRTSATDTRYGTRVVITADGPVYDYCQCGGLAYVGVYGDASANAYQPAWVFTDGTTTDGVSLAQAISHEVGHTLGLHHDGTTATAGDNYYSGSSLWAPIMGASYYSPVTQWSRGEYALANNTEDDIAIIGRVLGVKPDDHADGLAGAEALPTTASQRAGVIGTRSDVDAFTLTTDQATAISARPTGYQPDLDLSMTITDAATGQVVAKVDPAAAVGGGVAAVGLGADYRLPAGPVRTYLVTIDGVGNGDPRVAGHYSDYASEGAYLLTVDPGASVAPTAAPPGTQTTTAPPAPRWRKVSLRHARIGRAYRDALTAAGGTGTLRWSVVGKLPPGLRLKVEQTGRRLVVAGTGRKPGRWRVTLRGTDGAGRVLTRTVSLSVRR